MVVLSGRWVGVKGFHACMVLGFCHSTGGGGPLCCQQVALSTCVASFSYTGLIPHHHHHTLTQPFCR